MGVGVVRAVGRSAAHSDARPIQPWFDVAALPDSLTQALGVALGLTVLAFGVLRPIQREAVAHEPFAKICATDRTGRDRPAIGVEVQRKTADRAPGDEGVEVVCGHRAAAVLELSSQRHSWLLSGASIPQRRIRVP